MNCPNCSKSPLAPQALDGALQAKSCSTCGGQWIDSTQYFRWLSSRPKARMGEHVVSEAKFDVIDGEHARLCPECSRIMMRFRVGSGVEFYIDRCTDCGGLWLDNNEWKALEARKLHDDLHFVFSAAWQDRLREEEIAASREAWLIKQLGEERYQHLKETREWLQTHPHREALLAYLGV